MNLNELTERWEKDLGVAESFLPNEPMGALSATRVIADEIEGYIGAHPDAGRALTSLLARAHAALARSRNASERWLAAAAERNRRYREHEQRRATLPMDDLRAPWPRPATA